MDELVRAIAANAQIRAFAVTSTQMVEYARKAHNTSPVVTATLGRLMSGASMMGSMLKGESDILTLQVTGDGAVGGLVVTADNIGNVKGYANNPQAMCPVSATGKLDVGNIVGNGVLHVIKDMGLKEPYSSKIELVTGEIGDDLSAYFIQSEQTPSVVGLGVLMNKNNTVRCSGGFIIQAMPFADNDIIEKLEEKAGQITSVTSLLDTGMHAEELLVHLLGDMDVEITDKHNISFKCNCSKGRVEKVLISMGKTQLEELIADNEDIELNCQFCGKKYKFSSAEIRDNFIDKI